jgi:hypothetical protein
MKFLTSGEIARLLAVDRDKVSYALRKLALQPTGTAGQVKVYPETSLEAVRGFLNDKVNVNKKGILQR